MLDTLPAETYGLKLIEKLVHELLTKKSKDVKKDFIFAHSDNLSLFLTLRHTYLSKKYKD